MYKVLCSATYYQHYINYYTYHCNYYHRLLPPPTTYYIPVHVLPMTCNLRPYYG